MKKLLVVVDMQNDFITGSLGTNEAPKIIKNVAGKIRKYEENGSNVVYTRDTHFSDYDKTQEGIKLPVSHCVRGTEGWQIEKSLQKEGMVIFDKPTFGSIELAEFAKAEEFSEIELCGLCTDICVIANAIVLKTYLPEAKIQVDAKCCAGTTPENHKNALSAMKMCQIEVL